jgi:predicted MFS family arabinose efflux permease
MTQPHWSLIATVFATQAIAVGAVFGAFSVFVPPVEQTFGAPRGQFASGIGLMALMLGITGVIWGRWIDTGAFRRIMLCGCFATTACFVVASLASSVAVLAATCIVMGSFIPLVGPLTGSALIGKVFVESRGRAMGLASMGPPTGTFIFALLAGELITRFDWRFALRVFAAVSLLLVPLVALTIPRRVVTAPTEAELEGGEWTRSRLLRTRDFWGAALAMGITAGLATGWGGHFVSFAVDLGYDLSAGARIAAIAGGVGIVGTLGFGILADRFDPKWLMFGVILAQVAAFGVYLGEPPYAGLVGAATLFGVCGGSIVTLYALILAGRFGPAALGQALGLTNLFVLPFGALSAPVGAALRVQSGSYTLTIVVFACVLAVAAASLLLVRRSAQSG